MSRLSLSERLGLKSSVLCGEIFGFLELAQALLTGPGTDGCSGRG